MLPSIGARAVVAYRLVSGVELTRTALPLASARVTCAIWTSTAPRSKSTDRTLASSWLVGATLTSTFPLCPLTCALSSKLPQSYQHPLRTPRSSATRNKYLIHSFYWTDQPQRIEIVNRFPDYPIRMFPQSIYMTKPDRIKATTDSFEQHPDLQLGARDKPSFDWLQKTFRGRAQDTIDPSFDAPAGYANGEGTGVVRTTLTPDIVFMYGNRPDHRNQPKQ